MKKFLILLFILLGLFVVSQTPTYAAGVSYDSSSIEVQSLKFAVTGSTLVNADYSSPDLDGDGVNDLIISAIVGSARNVYLIYGTKLAQFSFGQTVDLAQSQNYNVVFYGTTGLGFYSMNTGDIDGDGKKDLVIGSYSGPLTYGSVYVIYNSLFRNYTGTGNSVNLSSSANFNIRMDGTNTDNHGTFGSPNTLADIDNDGRPDLLIASDHTSFSGIVSGSVYILTNTLMRTFSGTGNVLSADTASNYSLRIDGSANPAGGNLGKFGIWVADLDNDGKNELVVPCWDCGFNSRASSGSVYVIANSMLQSTGTGNSKDLDSTSNYSLRIDGANSGDAFGYEIYKPADIDGDGYLDLILSAENEDEGGSNSGSVYVVYSSKFRSSMGSGNKLDLATSSNWNLRMDGTAPSETLGTGGGAAADVTGDGRVDIILGDSAAGINGKSNSGSVFLLDNALLSSYSGTGNILSLSSSNSYTLRIDGDAANRAIGNRVFANANDSHGVFFSGNDHGFLFAPFPTTITVNADNHVSETSPSFSGNAVGIGVFGTVANVQYQVNSNSVTGSWHDCRSDDGSFNSTQERFTCQLSGLSDGSYYRVYVRAKNSQGFYTVQPSYYSFYFKVGSEDKNNLNFPSGFAKPISSGPHYVGNDFGFVTAFSRGEKVVGEISENVGVLLLRNTFHDDLHVFFSQLAFEDLSMAPYGVKLPQNQGFDVDGGV